MKRKPDESKSNPTALASAKRDLRQLKQNSSATVAELKAFLKELKGRSPQEMLGIVASSQLARAIGLSCALVFGGIVIFTAVPFAMGGKEKAEGANPAKAAANPGPAPAPATSPAASPNPTGTPDQPATPGPALSRLGVDEEKAAPPNKNPLENDKENFLDGLD